MKQIDPQILLEEYRQLLESGNVDSLPLVISGSSMSPFLKHQRDTVYLSRLTRPVRRGDILLYRRRSGAYILHRVLSVEGESYTMIGDAHRTPEPGIHHSQVIAIMTAALRRGRQCAPGSLVWDFYEKIWIRLVPLRPGILKIGSALKRLLTRRHHD